MISMVTRYPLLKNPKKPASNRAVTGLYVYPNTAVEIAKGLNPSARGEIEITDINQDFLESGDLSVIDLSKSDSWFDTGTIDSLYEATDYVRALESRIGVKVGCIEEAAFLSNFMSIDQVAARAEKLSNTSYGDYLNQIKQSHGG